MQADGCNGVGPSEGGAKPSRRLHNAAQCQHRTAVLLIFHKDALQRRHTYRSLAHDAWLRGSRRARARPSRPSAVSRAYCIAQRSARKTCKTRAAQHCT